MSLTANLAKKNLLITFVLCLCFFLFVPLFLPKWKLFYFSPFLVTLFYQKSKIVSLFGALFCGLLVDLFSTQAATPLFAINYCLTVLFLYDRRQHFFGDSFSTLPIMVVLFGVLTTLIHAVLQSAFYKSPFFSFEWFAVDVLFLPFLDAAYAFVVFVLPALLFGKPQRRGREYFSG